MFLKLICPEGKKYDAYKKVQVAKTFSWITFDGYEFVILHCYDTKIVSQFTPGLIIGISDNDIERVSFVQKFTGCHESMLLSRDADTLISKTFMTVFISKTLIQVEYVFHLPTTKMSVS